MNHFAAAKTHTLSCQNMSSYGAAEQLRIDSMKNNLIKLETDKKSRAQFSVGEGRVPRLAGIIITINTAQGTTA